MSFSWIYILTLAPLLLISGFCLARQVDLDTLKQLDSAELIERAKDKLKTQYPDFDFKTFNHTKINSGTDWLCVAFSVPIKYVRLNTVAKYSINVSLFGSCPSSYSVIYNGKVSVINIPVYSASKADEKTIKHLIKITGGSPSTALKTVAEDPNAEVVIKEREDHYAVTIDSNQTSRGYFIEKGTDRIYGAWSKHTDSEFSIEDINNSKNQ